MRAYRMQSAYGGGEGSCFGVTDPSRLRPSLLLPSRKSGPVICRGCQKSSKHKCAIKIFALDIKIERKTGKFTCKRSDVHCECKTCHPDKLRKRRYSKNQRRSKCKAG